MYLYTQCWRFAYARPCHMYNTHHGDCRSVCLPLYRVAACKPVFLFWAGAIIERFYFILNGFIVIRNTEHWMYSLFLRNTIEEYNIFNSFFCHRFISFSCSQTPPYMLHIHHFLVLSSKCSANIVSSFSFSYSLLGQPVHNTEYSNSIILYRK